MINLFQFAPNDASLVYLGKIFGSVGGVLPGGSITLLSTMFQTFNSIILTVAVLVVLYTVIVGVMLTAHEGQFMGKNWNNMWIPIRTVLGIASLVPIGGGYSMLQILMMWCIVQGIGAADTVWTTALNFVQVAGSPAAQISVPTTGATQGISDLFRGLVCDASARFGGADPTNTQGGDYFCHATGGYCGGGPPVFDPSSTTFSMGPNGSCGTMTYCNQQTECASDPNSLGCLTCKAQLDVLPSIISTLYGIAQQFVATDYAYRDFAARSGQPNAKQDPSWQFVYQYCSSQSPAISKNACCFGGEDSTSCQAKQGENALPPVNGSNQQSASDAAVNKMYLPFGLGKFGNFLDTTSGLYMNAVQQTVTSYLTGLGNNSSQLQGQLSDANSTGWIFAGAYYYVVASMNRSNLDASMPTFKVSLPDFSSDNQMSGYRNNFTASGTMVNAGSSSSSTGMFDNPKFSSLNPVMGTTFSSASNQFKTNLSGGAPQGNGKLDVSNTNPGNPLSRLQITGLVLTVIVEVAFVVWLGITIALGFAGFFDAYVFGTGVVNPIGPTGALIYFLLVPLMFGAFGIMVTVGGMLGVYVPLIPYVVFTMGAIGWMISTLEAMIAGPLVAIGIISPSGQHELLGKAEPALFHLFAVFLRPSLMIFGMMAAMLLAPVVVGMIDAAFWTTVNQGVIGQGASQGGTVVMDIINPIELIIFLCAYVMLTVTALNKCFATIYIIPDRVMRWLGHHGEGVGGEAEALGQVKGGTEAGGHGVKGGLDSGRGTTEGAYGKRAERGEIAPRQKKQAAGQGTPTAGTGGSGTPPPTTPP